MTIIIQDAPAPGIQTRLRRLAADDRGSAAAELTLVTPLLIVLLLFVVFCGRLADADLRVTDAAHQAARAASLARSSGEAVQDALATAQDALAEAGLTCQALTVSTDTQGLQPGVTVTVTVSCDVGLADLGLLGVSGSRTVAATYTSIVDVYRGGARGFTNSEGEPDGN